MKNRLNAELLRAVHTLAEALIKVNGRTVHKYDPENIVDELNLVLFDGIANGIPADMDEDKREDLIRDAFYTVRPTLGLDLPPDLQRLVINPLKPGQA